MPGDAAEKYACHPRETPTLLGHDEAEQALLSAWNQNRFAHAWLVTGPRGIGKATLAYRLARFVLAGGGSTNNLFGEPNDLAIPTDDPVFRRIAANAHSDLKVIERSFDPKRDRLRDEIIVADARKLVSFFAMTAAESEWRVAIVDSADEMNRIAANALLKTLEEPPSRGLLVLIAHAPGRVPATLRSRCRRLSLRPLATDLVEQIVKEHQPDLADDARTTLARLSDGSPGRALALSSSGGIELYGELVELLAHLPAIDTLAVHRLGDRVSRRDAGDTFRTLTDLLIWWLERMIRAAATGTFPTPVVSGENELMARLAVRGGLERWCGVWEKVCDLFSAADDANLDRKQVLINVFSTLQATSRT